MKALKSIWFILSLIPVPFLFLYIEYQIKATENNDSLLLLEGLIISVIAVGALAVKSRIRAVIGLNIVSTLCSLLLAGLFLPDNWWFAPFGRNFAVIFVSFCYIMGQLVVRGAAKALLKRSTK
ncbi:hypothetical protein JOC78_002186 [Bacillus ectoiniformans]|uniref:hypothetical protein n=1 Tax=Bacillus ectoiniformans TaxID=1494429 RepID=UPI00195742AE|nr:hypothetical protein [Bacillus ectoiniformans]MBM7649233.1 hypothetical protein [Bacillus ectoiniformans]